MRIRDSGSVHSGVSIRFAPAASAMEHSPARRLWHARWTATSEEEQAVSTTRLGPCRSKKYESRPEAML